MRQLVARGGAQLGSRALGAASGMKLWLGLMSRRLLVVISRSSRPHPSVVACAAATPRAGFDPRARWRRCLFASYNKRLLSSTSRISSYIARRRCARSETLPGVGGRVARWLYPSPSPRDYRNQKIITSMCSWTRRIVKARFRAPEPDRFKGRQARDRLGCPHQPGSKVTTLFCHHRMRTYVRSLVRYSRLLTSPAVAAKVPPTRLYNRGAAACC